MSNKDIQDEEREVILSIYDGDTAFNQLSPNTFQYKYGEDGDAKSFLVEIVWTEDYPSDKPVVNMDTFYNNHIVSSVKEKIVAHLDQEAEQWLGTAMTYTLFESVKEKFEQLISEQPEFSVQERDDQDREDKENFNDKSGVKREKKEQLSKAQKRKQWDRVDSKDAVYLSREDDVEERKRKLPPPSFSDSVEHSVFVNRYVEAENNKMAVLEKHVKMVPVKTRMSEINGKKVCWMYRKGRCRFGHTCKFAHDSDIISTSTQPFTDPQPSTELQPGAQLGDSTPVVKPERKRKKKPGLSETLVPGKRVMKMFNSNNASSLLAP